jgi:putative addiction module component (TIGR02574 family)
MSTAANDIFAAAISLPTHQRAELAARLLESLDSDESEHSQAEIDEAWRKEIEARERDILEGRVQTIPHEEVMAEIRSHLAARKAK